VKDMERREAVVKTTILGVAAAGEVGINKFRLFRENAKLKRRLEVENDVSPGITVARYRPDLPYFSYLDGPLPWYESFLTARPFNRAARASFELVVHNPEMTGSYGDLLQTLLLSAHFCLRDESRICLPDSGYPDNLNDVFANERYKDELLLFLAVHGASLLNSYTENFNRKLGYSRDEYVNAWNKKTGYMRVFKEAGILLATREASGPEYLGMDRMIHVTHHMALIVILGLSKKYKLPYVLETPAIIRSFAEYAAFLSADEALRLASFIAGWGYEFFMTLKSLGKSREYVQDGFFDLEIDFDLTANKLGALIGLYLLRMKDLGDFVRLREALKDPELRERRDAPKIPAKLLNLLTR
jgi:hypothetical protein